VTHLIRIQNAKIPVVFESYTKCNGWGVYMELNDDIIV
jgi:hypothetical protein